MANIPNAEPSPRIVEGVLKWYQGDTFSIDLDLSDLVDQDGAQVVLVSGDNVKVTFINRSGTVVKTFDFSAFTNNRVTLVFDATATALFSCGQYLYDVYVTHSNRVTLANRNKAVVE